MSPVSSTTARILSLGVACAALLALACDGDKPRNQVADSGVPGNPDAGADSGAPGNPDTLAIGVPAPSGLVVVNSDFKVTSVSLLDPVTRAVLRDDCINSQTASPTLSSRLSGDVTLPSQPQLGNELALIDRGNSAISWLDPSNCTVKRQLSVMTGFRSNPKDLVTISDSKAYVPRYEPNAAAGAQENDGGDDVLIIDPTMGKILGRIDMAPHASAVAGKAIHARPDRVVLADGKVFVSLNSLDAMFEASGEGRLVVIDPTTDTVSGTVEIPGMKGCSAMAYIASSKTLLVVCGGFFGDADQGAASGIVLVDVAATPPAVTKTLPASAVAGGQPLNFSSIVAVSPTAVLVSAIGRFADPASNIEGAPDALLLVDIATEVVTKLMDGGAFELGRSAGSDSMAMVPLGSMRQPRVHVFGVTAGALTKVSDFDPSPARGLPPREIAWY